jgi:O-antigen/teichoic acid export membrane protein
MVQFQAARRGAESVVSDIPNTAAAVSPAVERSLRLHRILLDTGPLVVSRYAAAALGLASTVIATRWLGISGFGEATLALAYPMLLWSIASVKSVSITTRYMSAFRAPGERDNLKGICLLGYVVDLAISLGAAIVVFATAKPLAARFYGAPQLGPQMMLLAASFPFYSLIGTNQAILTSFERFRTLGFLAFVEALLQLIFVVVGRLLTAAPIAYVGAIAGAQALAGIIGFWLAGATLHDHLGTAWWHGARLAALRGLKGEIRTFFGWNYAMVTVSGFVDQFPALLLGKYSGTSSVAYYRLSTTLMVSVGYVEASLWRVVYPTLVTDWNAGAFAKLRQDLRAMTLQIGVPVAFAIIAGALVVTRHVVPLFFGASYVGMVPGAQWMIASAGVSAAVFWLYPYYYSAGRVALWSKLYFLYASALLCGVWLLSGRYGFFGVALLVASCRVLLAIAGFAVARSRWFAR